jgi:hypothetical protein
LCGGTGYPLTPNYAGRGEWAECHVGCKDSKIMLAFERHQPGVHYLGEKIFLPLEYGAISAYFGNGHEYLDLLRVNRRSFIDRSAFPSDDEFAENIVHLLRYPKELQKMQEEIVFFDPVMAWKRIFYFEVPELMGEAGAPELYRALRNIEKFRKLSNRSGLKVRTGGNGGQINIIQHILNITSIVHVKDENDCPELEAFGCCA